MAEGYRALNPRDAGGDISDEEVLQQMLTNLKALRGQ